MTNFLARCRLLVFFLKCKRWWLAKKLPTCFHLLGFFLSVSSLAASPLDVSLLYLPIRGDVTTPSQLYLKLLHKTHISLKVANILKDWATFLFSIKEIPRCCNNSKFVFHHLEDLKLTIDLYIFILGSIGMFA
jgi:hypothetical protein